MIEVLRGSKACSRDISADILDDPILELILGLQEKIADYNANAPGDDDGANRYAERSYRPALAAVRRWTSPARTRRGALAALRLARDAVNDGDQELAAAMIRAALAYFETT